MPRALDVNGRNLTLNVGYIQERYALNTYHYLSTTRWLPNLAELVEQVKQIPAADWKRLFALQPLLEGVIIRPSIHPAALKKWSPPSGRP